jgi:AraC-like DNA-binding protein
MDGQNSFYSGNEGRRFQANIEELVERISRAVPVDGVIEPLKGLILGRVSTPLAKIYSAPKPSFCVIAQGSKEVLLGDTRYRYDSGHYLLATLELPRVSYVVEASRSCPYLSFRLEFDPAVVSSIMVEAGQFSADTRKPVSAVDVGRLDVNLQDAIVRLVRLLETPAEAQVLMPLIIREIVFRLLQGEQGDRLRNLAIPEGNTPRIAMAVEKLRQDFNQPLRIEDLARELGMSVSGLHHHFKAVTSMSVLQFQKQLRLQEARRLMLSEGFDASSAAFRVGYHDPSYFSREYKNLFGAPPMHDMQGLREDTRAYSL